MPNSLSENNSPISGRQDWCNLADETPRFQWAWSQGTLELTTSDKRREGLRARAVNSFDLRMKHILYDWEYPLLTIILEKDVRIELRPKRMQRELSRQQDFKARKRILWLRAHSTWIDEYRNYCKYEMEERKIAGVLNDILCFFQLSHLSDCTIL